MSATSASARVHIDVVSDVVCPWCYIGKHRLERALALYPAMPVEVEYQPYFLNPWIPRDGIDRKTYLETKFGCALHFDRRARRRRGGRGRSRLCGRQDQPPTHTLDCHRLMLWARNGGDPAR